MTGNGCGRARSLAVVDLAGPAERELDAESANWVRCLSADNTVRRQQAEGELHARLLRIAAGEVAAGRYPGIAVHLAAGGPCSEDFDGLLAAVTSG
jgi:hypothetical protein